MSFMHSIPLFELHIVFKSNQSLIYNGKPNIRRICHKFDGARVCGGRVFHSMPFHKRIWTMQAYMCISIETIVFLWKQIHFKLYINRSIMMPIFLQGFSVHRAYCSSEFANNNTVAASVAHSCSFFVPPCVRPGIERNGVHVCAPLCLSIREHSTFVGPLL